MPRLIDLHCDWPLQYATETTVFDPSLYSDVPARISQADGYLSGVSAAVVACYRRATDWARQASPWAALDALITRIEAEFSGRIVTGPDDLGRWSDDRDGLCWAVIGVEGFDALVRSPDDLERLPVLFERGVRVFQPVYGSASLLGGSSEPGDDRGLTDLGRAFLERLSGFPDGPCPLVDLAHLNPLAMSEALGWFESRGDGPGAALPIYSHGAPVHDRYGAPRAITLDNLGRLRALGGTVGFSVGPPFFESPDALRSAIESAAAVPFKGEPGYEGIAIGTDFLGVNKTLPALGNVGSVVDWLTSTFPGAVAELLIEGNARRLIATAACVVD